MGSGVVVGSAATVAEALEQRGGANEGRDRGTAALAKWRLSMSRCVGKARGAAEQGSKVSGGG
ncbi:UNVERIFIED_CONTAM: hypothetical protein Sangu_2006500 [Sesamum angustifolium]|uniref:Uncharacterized protein n=1 Tax=Sesamum angustifolium TaxID=2727405 RepID=A0AAW2LJP8_9LAMI